MLSFIKSMYAFVKKDSLYLLIITVAALILVADLFLIPGRGITFDGHIHMTTIAQYAQALSDGEFPVVWSNNFANFGLPLPIFSHQLPIYIGAFFELILQNPVISYNIVLFVGAWFSAISAYFLFRKFSNQSYSLIGALIYNFAAYRIINIYIRGAMPEIFASIFLPVILVGIINWFRDKKINGLWLTLFGLVGLALSHPMVLITSSIIFVPMVLYYNWPTHKHIYQLLRFGVVGVLAVFVSGYYLFPLILESKYFYIGIADSSISRESFLSVKNIISPAWYYFKEHPGPRGDFVKLGIVEAAIIFGGILHSIIDFIRRRKFGIFQLFGIISLVLIVLLLPISQPIYNNVPYLSKIQFPWRMLGSLILIPPLYVVLFLEKFFRKLEHNKGMLVGILILAVVFILRIPQLYSKNSAVYDIKNYYFTQTNLHTQNLNTIWSGNSEDYPKKTAQFEVVEGNANIIPILLKNSLRQYQISANEKVRMVDYTFYYPGWKVLIDGAETPIQFQDPNYRGLITYNVPAGTHDISVVYTHTKVRLLGYFLTIFGISVITLIAVIQRRSQNFYKFIDPKSYK